MRTFGPLRLDWSVEKGAVGDLHLVERQSVVVGRDWDVAAVDQISAGEVGVEVPGDRVAYVGKL